MTRFKVTLKEVNISEVSKRTSKRGNNYLLLDCTYKGEDLKNVYFPDYDTDLNFEQLKGVHDLDVEVIISKYASLKVLKVN